MRRAAAACAPLLGGCRGHRPSLDGAFIDDGSLIAAVVFFVVIPLAAIVVAVVKHNQD